MVKIIKLDVTTLLFNSSLIQWFIVLALLSVEILDKYLPVKTYMTHLDTLETEICTVCMEDFGDGDHIRVLNCQHLFHSHCIDKVKILLWIF